MPKRGQTRTAPQGLRRILAENIVRLMAESEDLRTNTALAKRSGVGRRTIDRLAAGDHGASIDTVEAVGEALGVYPWRLLIPRVAAPRATTGTVARAAVRGEPRFLGMRRPTRGVQRKAGKP